MLSKLQKSLKQKQALLVSDRLNIRYLSGFHGSNALILITKKQASLLTDFRYSATVKSLPKQIRASITTDPSTEILNILKREKIKKLRLEAENITIARLKRLKKSLPGITLVAGESLIEPLRVSKTAEEIVLIKKAQQITEKTFKHILSKIKTGITEIQLAHDLEKTAMDFGAEKNSFPPIVAFGKNSACPHHESGNAKLKKGDIILLDMGFKYKGYCSDMTRMLFTAPPTPLQKEVYMTVLKAQTEAIKILKAGIKGGKVDKTARDIIKKAGYGDKFGHGLGHGVGLNVHEVPYLSTKYQKPLPLNAVVTVEPGIYLENSFGVRIEDMVLVERDKTTNLTKIPKKIKDLILSIS